jgi:hypothetical protein
MHHKFFVDGLFTKELNVNKKQTNKQTAVKIQLAGYRLALHCTLWFFQSAFWHSEEQ